MAGLYLVLGAEMRTNGGNFSPSNPCTPLQCLYTKPFLNYAIFGYGMIHKYLDHFAKEENPEKKRDF